MDEPQAQEAPQQAQEAPPTPEERMAAVLQRQEEPEAPAVTDETSEAPSEEATPSPKEEASDAKEGDSEEEVEAVTVSSLAELMENVGADVESMYDLTFPVTLDGERTEIPLSEIKDSFRATKEAQRFQEEAKQAREQAKAAAQQATEQAKMQLAQANRLAEGLDAMYLAPYQNVDWVTLRQEDPAEYAAKYQEYLSTRDAVNQQKQAVLQEIQQFQAQTQAETAKSVHEVLARERDALNEKWPEMANPEKADAERSGIINFLKSDGFSDEEIGNVQDHRVLLMARDAMRYREQAKQAGAAKKKVIKVGKKVLTPGAAQNKAEKANNAQKTLRDRLRKSGRIEDAAALLSQRLNR